MKSKIYKLLSILLTVMIVFTSCVIAVGVQANSGTSGITKEYFVKMGSSGTGTEDAPFGNIGAAVTKAVSDSYTTGDTVAVTILDDGNDGADTIDWGTFPESYAFNLKVQTASGATAANISLPDKACFASDIEFANVNVNAGGSWPARKVYFGGHNIVFGADTTLSSDYVTYGKESGNVNFSAQKVQLKGALKGTTYIYLTNEVNGNVVRNEDVFLKLNSSNGVVTLGSNYGTTKYEGNVNFDLTGVGSVKLQDFGNAGGWTIDGALQILYKEGLSITNESLLTTYAPAGGIYKIVNDTGLANFIEFVPGTAGKYKIIADTEVYNFTVEQNGDKVDGAIVKEGGSTYIELDSAGTYTIKATKAPATKELFVKAGATGGEGTQDAPFGTIGKAVTYAVDNGYIAGDKVTVTIIDDEAVEGGDTVDWGTFPISYTFALKVQTALGSPAATTNLPDKACLGGDTEFANITVNAGGAWPARKVYFGGNDITFKADAALNTDYVIYGRESGNAEYGAQKVIIDGTLTTGTTYIYLTNEKGAVTFSGDLTTKINSPNAVISPSANSGTTTYKNVNIDFGDITTTKFHKFDGNFAINGALQMLCEEGLVITNESIFTTNAPTKGIYKITDAIGLKELIEFVPDVAGKYKLLVDTNRFTVTVKDGQGTEYPLQTMGSEKYIELPATGGGAFTITAQKTAETKEYYVSADGKSDNPGTEAKPFLTIADAVKEANNNGITKGDTVIVIVKGDAQVNWGAVSSHSFEITVKSESDQMQASVVMADNTVLSGDTVFENIKLTAKGLCFNDHDVTFDVGTEYSVEYPAFGTSRTPSTVNGQTVIYRGEVYAPYTKITNDSTGEKIYTDDVNIIVDNQETQLGLYLKSNHGATKYEENANLNIDIKKAKAVRFIDAGGSIEHKGAIQIMYKQGLQLNGKDLISAANPEKGVYWIVNNSGYDDLLGFTETVGKYKVNSEYDVIAVSKSDSSEVKAKNGYLTFDKPGEYVVRVDRPVIAKDYYVSADGISVVAGTRPKTAGTKANPVKTIADATRLIAQDPLGSLDTANIMVATDQEVEWGEDAVNCAPALVIKSAEQPKTATVVSSKGIVFAGNTRLESVILVQKNMNAGVGFGHYNVVIDSNSTISTNYINIGGVTSPGTVTEPQNIEVYGLISAMEFKLATGYGNTTYDNKINIIVDNAETSLNVKLGARSGTTTTYNGDIYINVKNAKAISFDKLIADATVNVGGTIQLIVNKDVSVTQAVKTNFNKIEAGGGKWYITNYSSTPDLISFGDEVGTFNIKDNKKAYVRQYDVKKMDTFEGGKVILSSGEYVISDEEIPYLSSDLHKMLYFRNSGHLQNLYVRVPVTPGETYRMEYSVWSSRYEDLNPVVMQNGDYRWALGTVEIISEEKVNNYYKVVCEITVPEEYSYPTAFFGIEMFPFDEGYLFDVSVYNKNDKKKTNIMPNNNLHSGLDYWAVGYEFWGAIFTGDNGGTGRLEFNGNTKLKVVNFSIDTIQELIDACSPNDGKWWTDDQVKEDEIYTAYAGEVKGTLKDTNGNPVANHKVQLISSLQTYTAITDSKGNFTFKDKIVIGYYELYVITERGKNIQTGYATFIEEADKVTFNLVISYGDSQSQQDSNSDGVSDVKDGITVEGGERVEEIVPSGNLFGTVYTPYLETVSGVRIYIEGINGQVTTNENGEFGFGNLPVGTYRLYTVLSDGSEYTFREVEIFENSDTNVKLKYDPPKTINADGANDGWVIWVIVASVVALIVIAGLILVLIFKKKKDNVTN